MSKKVLFIGLDGGTFDVLDPFMEAGIMPRLKRFSEEGVRGPLETTIPPITPTAWVSFMTGKNPGKHGVFEFLLRRKGSGELPDMPVSSNARDGLPFWDILGNLGKQAEDEFANFEAPDDPRKFPILYTVQRLKANAVNPAAKVVITTIQRLYSMLKGEREFDPGNEEGSAFDTAATWQGAPPEVAYNAGIPPEFFDFIVVDECHRSIYELWSQVLLYFDAFLIGLTATPSKQTFGFFNQNLVMEYGHEQAVADGVNVNYDVYRIKTEITEGGSKVDAGYFVDKRDRATRAVRWEQLDEDLEYDANQLDRVFTIAAGRTAILTGLTHRNGYTDDAAGIQNSGTLTVSHSVVR